LSAYFSGRSTENAPPLPTGTTWSAMVSSATSPRLSVTVPAKRTCVSVSVTRPRAGLVSSMTGAVWSTTRSSVADCSGRSMAVALMV